MTNKLEQLASLTEIVADSGDLDAIRRLNPQDATTNPSLLLKLAQSPEGEKLLKEARHLAHAISHPADLSLLCDAFAALAGQSISHSIDGLVSTEVDARLSFDLPAMLMRARRLHLLYRELGVPSEHILIKLASTWQGIRAAELLESEGIACNMTLLFNLTQAMACADANVTLISPFVGRIYDWHLKQGANIENAQQDPGVESVKAIHSAYLEHGIDTIIMGASFRNVGQIEALAGCDKLTISPSLLDSLAADSGHLNASLSRDAMAPEETPFNVSEAQFYLQMCQDPMATELLADGIRRFITDQQALEGSFNLDQGEAHARTA